MAAAQADGRLRCHRGRVRAQWSLGTALRADIALFIALFIALYSLALHGRMRRLPWACGVMAGAVVLVAVRVSAAVSVWDALFFTATGGRSRVLVLTTFDLSDCSLTFG
ncbi:hypothetical protein ADL01_02415 [Streptomyces sp. NRRL WC-3618]|nr:hypothetical protein ADL01_02415 [Streptomyces sp. NRRL WC-3618]